MSRPHTKTFVHFCFEKSDSRVKHPAPFGTSTETNTNWFRHYIPISRTLKLIIACASEEFQSEELAKKKDTAEPLNKHPECNQQTTLGEFSKPGVDGNMKR